MNSDNRYIQLLARVSRAYEQDAKDKNRAREQIAKLDEVLGQTPEEIRYMREYSVKLGESADKGEIAAVSAALSALLNIVDWDEDCLLIHLLIAAATYRDAVTAEIVASLEQLNN